MRYALKRPCQILAEAGIAPEQVSQAIADQLGAVLEERQILRRHRASYTNFVKQWNRARTLIPGWPDTELRIEDRRNRYVLPADAFPLSFRREVEAWLREETGTSLRRRRKAVRPATANGHRIKIWELASAAVHGGIAIETLTSLHALVRAPVVATALEWIAVRREGESRPHLHNLAILACTFAGRFVADAEPHCKAEEERNRTELAIFRANLRPDTDGMSQKNRDLLKRFKDPDVLARFLVLPEAVFAEVLRRRPIKRNDAVRAQIALAMEILLHAPVRIEKLARDRV